MPGRKTEQEAPCPTQRASMINATLSETLVFFKSDNQLQTPPAVIAGQTQLPVYSSYSIHLIGCAIGTQNFVPGVLVSWIHHFRAPTQRWDKDDIRVAKGECIPQLTFLHDVLLVAFGDCSSCWSVRRGAARSSCRLYPLRGAPSTIRVQTRICASASTRFAQSVAVW